MKNTDLSLPFLCVVGVDHHRAPLDIIERTARAMPCDTLDKSMMADARISEAMMLTTCNRAEMIFFASSPEEGLAMLRQQSHWPDDFDVYGYALQGTDALQHLVCLASGLCSMFVGEPQIFGQLKKALEYAQTANTTGNRFNTLMPYVYRAAKKIRTTCQLQDGTRSLSHLVAKTIRQTFSHGKEKPTVLCLGAGDMMQAIARVIHPDVNMVIASRRQERAQALAEPYRSPSLTFDELTNGHWPTVDVVIAAARSPIPMVTETCLRQMLRPHPNSQLLLFDLAVPRNIDATAKNLDQVIHYNLTDLEKQQDLQDEAQQCAQARAEAMIEDEVQEITQALQSLQADPIIGDWRQYAEALRQQTLSAAQKALATGEAPDVVIAHALHQLCQKLMHHPSEALRQAASQADHDLLSAAKRLFATEHSTDTHSSSTEP